MSLLGRWIPSLKSEQIGFSMDPDRSDFRLEDERSRDRTLDWIMNDPKRSNLRLDDE